MAERERYTDLQVDLLEGQSPFDRARRAIDFALNTFVGKRDAPKVSLHLLALKTCTPLISQRERDALIQEVEARRSGHGFPDHKGEVADFILKLINR